MRKWLLLAAAIGLEVTATLSLRAALDQPAWYALVAAGYVGAFVMLGMVLRAGLGLGVAYGIWGASGVALTALLATALYGDPLTGTMGVGIVLVIGGVLCVELGSQAAQRRPDSPHGRRDSARRGGARRGSAGRGGAA
ncbi:SMR family transporter [Streptomyces sp. NPDC046887]|uniref:DMT family transporter n=1 Tax=Streptomyces sp. NPDC046887 TaxID=3155472 RepID=UPI0033D58B73